MQVRYLEGLKVAVIGGGWYGCHIAYTLLCQGVSVTLFEANSTLFSEASGNNQFRLHLGFHYARSAETRRQSREGYQRFIERYPLLSSSVSKNVYLIPKDTSLMDGETYISIMQNTGIPFKHVDIADLPFLNAQMFTDALCCDERVINTTRAREFFGTVLKDNCFLNRKVELPKDTETPKIEGQRFDYVVDATWGGLADAHENFYFEPTLLPYYKLKNPRKEHPAITLVDGDLWSLYPTEVSQIYTLSSVTHTPLLRCRNKSEARSVLDCLGENELEAKQQAMEAEVRAYFPSFLALFERAGFQKSIKMKPIGSSDNRSASVERNGRLFHVRSGKIDTIFHATDKILGNILND